MTYICLEFHFIYKSPIYDFFSIAKWVWSDSKDHILLNSLEESAWIEYNHGRVVHVFTEEPTENRGGGDGVLIYDEDRHLYGYITKNRTFFGELSISKLNENINNKSEHKWFPKGYWEVPPSKCEDNHSSSDEDEDEDDLVIFGNEIARIVPISQPMGRMGRKLSSKYVF